MCKPACIKIDVREVFGQDSSFLNVWISPMKQVETNISKLPEKIGQMGGLGVCYRVVVPCLYSRVNLEGKLMRCASFADCVHHEILEPLSLL